MKGPYRKYRMMVYVTDQWTASGATRRLRKADVVKQVEGNELAGLHITVDRNSIEIVEEKPRADTSNRRKTKEAE